MNVKILCAAIFREVAEGEFLLLTNLNVLYSEHLEPDMPPLNNMNFISPRMRVTKTLNYIVFMRLDKPAE